MIKFNLLISCILLCSCRFSEYSTNIPDEVINSDYEQKAESLKRKLNVWKEYFYTNSNDSTITIYNLNGEIDTILRKTKTKPYNYYDNSFFWNCSKRIYDSLNDNFVKTENCSDTIIADFHTEGPKFLGSINTNNILKKDSFNRSNRVYHREITNTESRKVTSRIIQKFDRDYNILSEEYFKNPIDSEKYYSGSYTKIEHEYNKYGNRIKSIWSNRHKLKYKAVIYKYYDNNLLKESITVTNSDKLNSKVRKYRYDFRK